MNDVAAAREALRNNAGRIGFIGVVLLVLGILAVAAPLASGIAIAYLVGAAVLAAGAAQAIHSLSAKSWGAGVPGLLLGLLAIACGVLLIMHPLFNLGFLTLLLAAYFLMQGIASIVLGVRMGHFKGSGWTIFGGVVSLVLGLLIWIGWPLTGSWAVGTLVGIQLIFSGWAAIMLATAARSAAGALPA